MELFSCNILGNKNHDKKFLIFQETETLQKFLYLGKRNLSVHPEKIPYISGNGNPEKSLYILGNRNPEKILILPETELSYI